MAKRYFLFLWFFLGFFPGPGSWTVAQEGKPNIRVVVDMVQLNVAVTDSKGNYVTGLRPQDFVVAEDGIKGKDCYLRRRQRAHPQIAGHSAGRGPGRQPTA